ncbi:MAG: Holliday junction branch migration protein RuvA [Acidobacteria bacterium]|jgi:Holliday junction DNA helicase RuvA|nr:Holliday junction branch migration protein RuvA [Acidobacteriota bacterium]
MIGRLVGEAVERAPGRLVIDVAGVGYEVLISLTTYAALPAAGPVELTVHTHVRESEITLYGFLERRERRMFLRLQKVSGIGPKMALGILSQIPVEPLVDAIQQRDLSRLVALPGVGKRTAERIVTELSDKMDDLGTEAAGLSSTGAQAGDAREDVRLALLSLGYKESVVNRTLDEVLAGGPKRQAVEEILRRSLQQLAGRQAP